MAPGRREGRGREGEREREREREAAFLLLFSLPLDAYMSETLFSCAATDRGQGSVSAFYNIANPKYT